MVNAEASLKSRAAQLGEAAARLFRAPALGGVRAAAGRAWDLAKRRLWLSAGLAVLVLAGIGYFAISSEGSGGGEAITAVVSKGDIEDTVTAVGNLQPRDYVDVGAQVSGQLKTLDVQLGDTVKKGQLLAEIDPQVLSAKVEADKANLANLRAQSGDRAAQVALAKANFARQQRLMAVDATSKADYDGAQQVYKSAAAEAAALSAQISAAQSQLDGDQVTLGYTKIYAPMDGTVVSITTKQGMTVNANQQAPIILRVADLSTMTVWTQVSEADVPKLRIGMPAYFTTLGQPDKRWYGKLTQIQPTPDVVNNVVLYTATFDVANPGNDLMTQMTAQVFFVVASAHEVPTVPVAALHGSGTPQGGGADRAARRAAWRKAHPGGGLFGGGQRQFSEVDRQRFQAMRQQMHAAMQTGGAKRYWVQVMEPDGTIRRQPVAIGVSNRVSAQVLAGLQVGDKVVVGMKQTGEAPAADSESHHNRGFGPRLP